MFVASKYKKVMHHLDCAHVQSIKVDNRIYFDTVEEAMEQGYEFCLDCCEISNQYRKEENEIQSYCHQNALIVEMDWSHEELNVWSPYSQWIISKGQEGELVLYHRNTFGIQGEKTYIPGYHFQNVSKNTIIDYLIYIIHHDAYRLKYPAYPPRKAAKPHKKGTKKYQKRQKRRERKRSIQRVNQILQSLA